MAVKNLLLGREHEKSVMDELIDSAQNGSGGSILLKGSAGMGKSVLSDEFRAMADSKGLKVFSGMADADTMKPFHVFSELLSAMGQKPTLLDSEFTGFNMIFAVNRAGMLVADAYPGEETMDSDIFAGMLSAVQNFVRDSFHEVRGMANGLGRLEYGDLKIIIEHGENIFLTGVIGGQEHPDMKNSLRVAVNQIEEKLGEVLEGWKGDTEDVRPVYDMLNQLVEMDFLVRKNLDELKLDAERMRLADIIVKKLAKRSQDSALALIVEDIHWADESSLFVLEYIARNIPSKRICLLTTVRTEEMDAVSEVVERLSENCRTLELSGLNQKDVHAMVDGMLGDHELENQFIQNLYRQCQGNPFFVQEIINHMLEDGALIDTDKGFIMSRESYSIPENIEAVILRRVENLMPDEMAMVEFLSCIGTEFEPRVPSSTNIIREPEKAVSKLREKGILSGESFSHALFQEIIYKGISQRWKSAFHQEIGETYEREFDIENVIFELARHFSKSKSPQKGLDYCMRAGEKAEVALSPDRAVEYYRMAKESLDRIRGDKKQLEIEILIRLSDVRTVMGDTDMALENLQRALELEESTENKATIHMKRARAFERKADYEKSGQECEAGLSLADRDSDIAARLLIGLSGVALRTGDTERAMELSEKSLRIAERLDETRLVGDVLHLIGSIHLMRGKFGNSIDIYRTAIERKKEVGDIFGLAKSMNNLGVGLYYSGKTSEALRCFEECLEAYTKIGDKYGMAAALNNLGGYAQDLGELENALNYHEKSMNVKREIGDRYGVISSLSNMGIVYRRLGNYEKALKLHTEGLELARDIKNAKEILIHLNNLGETYLELGELDKAIEKYTESQEYDSDDLQQRCHAMRGLARAYIKKSDNKLALEYGQKALDIALETKNRGEEWRGRYILGAAHRIRKEWELAEKEFESSINIVKESEGGETNPAILYEFGLLYRDMGKKDEAKNLLKEARVKYERMGYTVNIQNIDEVLGNL